MFTMGKRFFILLAIAPVLAAGIGFVLLLGIAARQGTSPTESPEIAADESDVYRENSGLDGALAPTPASIASARINLSPEEADALAETYPILFKPQPDQLRASGLTMKELVRTTVADIPRLTASAPARILYEKIRACFPPEVTDFFEYFEHAPCYEKLMNEAAESYDPSDLINAVKALVAERPPVLTACHNGGHSASAIMTSRIWDPLADYDTQLKQMRSIMREADDVCQNGYVHGFYDAIGQGKPTEESFRAAAAVCYEVLSPTVDCGHGLGHSAWYATKDFKKASAICSVLKGYLKYRCDDGVIMYLPDVWSEGKGGWTADPRQDLWDADKFYSDAAEVCKWWPQTRPGDDDPLLGCWIGVTGGVLWRPITTLMSYGNYEDVADEAKELVRRAEAVCAEFGPRGEQHCVREWPGMVLYVAQNDVENILDLCSSMRRHEVFCVNKSLAQLEENLARDSETSRVVR